MPFPSKPQHYLENELHDLIAEDASVRSFVLHSAIDGISLRDLETPGHEWFSHGFWNTLGYRNSDRLHSPDTWSKLVHEEDLDKALHVPEAGAANSNPYTDQVLRYRHAQGHTVWVRSRGITIHDGDGRAVRMLGLHKNLNDRSNQSPAAAPSDVVARLRMARNALPEAILDISDGKPDEAIRMLELAMGSLDKVLDQIRDLNRT